LGYKVEVKHGYLFERKESPFIEFVSEIYKERQEAKKRGDMVTSSLHKLTMNSLYGRFGIKPEMNITEICDQERLDKIMSIYPYGIAEAINNTHYILTYTTQMQQKLRNEDCKDDSFRSMIHWMDSRNAGSSSAVQMSAAITAYARIHMYPYISLPGGFLLYRYRLCSTRQTVASGVSIFELGKFKLEYKVIEGYFLAPKCYAFKEDGDMVRYKGAANKLVNLKWFEEQYQNLERVQTF
jgi:hypothetical protein